MSNASQSGPGFRSVRPDWWFYDQLPPTARAALARLQLVSGVDSLRMASWCARLQDRRRHRPSHRQSRCPPDREGSRARLEFQQFVRPHEAAAETADREAEAIPALRTPGSPNRPPLNGDHSWLHFP